MPNYKYKCNECNLDWTQSLPISFSPTKSISCPFRFCEGQGERRIIGNNSIGIERETLGKWYKDNTGRELMGD